MKTRTPNSEASEIREDYFQWLVGLVGVSTPDHNYWNLARRLHEIEFYWTVPNDDNRAVDGKKLREDYLDETCSDCRFDSYLEGECTVLEMLIALAQRIEYILSDPSEGDKLSKWFYELITNLDLAIFNDQNYEDLSGDVAVGRRVDVLLSRSFSDRGHGGLFPLRRASKDQRKVEIWYQLMAYLDENYS